MRPHRRQPPRIPCPWDSPGKNTGVGCHFLLQCMKMKSQSEVAQSCPTLSDPMDCSPPGSSIHGIFQARVLEWAAITFSDLRASEANYCKLGVLEHEKFLLSQFWRPEVWIRSASRAILPLRPWGEMVLASCLLLAMASIPWFAAASYHLRICCYIILPVSSLHIIFTLCLSFLTGTPDGYTEQEPTRITSSWFHLQRLYFQIKSHSGTRT